MEYYEAKCYNGIFYMLVNFSTLHKKFQQLVYQWGSRPWQLVARFTTMSMGIHGLCMTSTHT